LKLKSLKITCNISPSSVQPAWYTHSVYLIILLSGEGIARKIIENILSSRIFEINEEKDKFTVL
jgi:hypothetical protein